MTPMGGTNISGGLDLGANALADAHTALRRIVLISDGEPTEGIGSGIAVDPRPLLAFAARRADQGASITAVGVGLTFREDIMAGIASAGRGNYYFVERAGDLSAMFARELGRLGETMFTAGELALRPGADVELLEAIGYPLVRDADGWRVPVADLRRGEQRKVVLRVRVNATRATQDIVAVTWRYRTLTGAAEQQLAVARAMVTGDAGEVERSRDVEALQLIEQARTAAALEQAAAAYGDGDGVRAREILVERQQVLQGYAGTLDGEAAKAMRDIQDATEQVERGFAEAPAAAAPAGLRARKGTSVQAYDLAH
jgi:Ca-activated chloride channel family protein